MAAFIGRHSPQNAVCLPIMLTTWIVMYIHLLNICISVKKFSFFFKKTVS